MKKLLSIGTLLFSWVMLQAQNRFPKPDFESGYQYPELHYAIPNETLWVVLDLFMLVLLMSIVVWAVYKKHTRKQYEINHAACVACALCFSYCPQNKNSVELRKSSES